MPVTSPPRTQVPAEAIWQWGYIERVSTGLHLMELGETEGAGVSDRGGSADAVGAQMPGNVFLDGYMEVPPSASRP